MIEVSGTEAGVDNVLRSFSSARETRVRPHTMPIRQSVCSISNGRELVLELLLLLRWECVVGRFSDV